MKYVNQQGDKVEIESKQDLLIEKLYQTILGRCILKLLVKPTFSKTAGAFLSSRFSCFLISPFVRANRIDLTQYKKTKYHSYNDFFTRHIIESNRPIDSIYSHLICPCDGKVTVYPIDEKKRFQIKNSVYTVESLLKSKKLAENYKDGYAVIIRLSVDDYHHYCYVDTGYQSKNRYIHGKLHTVNPIAVEQVPVYTENSREYSILHTQNFGTIIQVEVGALMVGKIKNLHQNYQFNKGEPKGYFEFGGSTIVLLLDKKNVTVLDYLLQNTSEGYETMVKMGEVIGYKVSQFKN